MLRGWRILVLREPRTTMRSHSSSSKSRSLRDRSAELDMARLDAAVREKAVSDACGGVRRALELVKPTVYWYWPVWSQLVPFGTIGGLGRSY